MKEKFNFKKKQKLIVEEFFYFLSSLLLAGLLVELIFPGLFILYFNVSLLAALWLLNLIYLLCITGKK